MKKFNRGDRFGNRDSGRSQMHHAICASCGKDCEVPFRPSGDRPVYCSDCFKDMGGGQRRSEGGDFRRPDRDNKRMFKAVCASCGQDCEVPFQPSSGKPVYCNNCFGKKDGAGSRKPDQSKDQFIALNDKLDKIIILLTKPASKETVKKEPASKPAAKKAAAKKSKSKKKK